LTASYYLLKFKIIGKVIGNQWARCDRRPDSLITRLIGRLRRNLNKKTSDHFRRTLKPENDYYLTEVGIFSYDVKKLTVVRNRGTKAQHADKSGAFAPTLLIGSIGGL